MNRGIHSCRADPIESLNFWLPRRFHGIGTYWLPRRFKRIGAYLAIYRTVQASYTIIDLFSMVSIPSCRTESSSMPRWATENHGQRFPFHGSVQNKHEHVALTWSTQPSLTLLLFLLPAPLPPPSLSLRQLYIRNLCVISFVTRLRTAICHH
eukprot:scaffold131591_cov36-Tisochrysis_lutea.AAC.1